MCHGVNATIVKFIFENVERGALRRLLSVMGCHSCSKRRYTSSVFVSVVVGMGTPVQGKHRGEVV